MGGFSAFIDRVLRGLQTGRKTSSKGSPRESVRSRTRSMRERKDTDTDRTEQERSTRLGRSESLLVVRPRSNTEVTVERRRVTRGNSDANRNRIADKENIIEKHVFIRPNSSSTSINKTTGNVSVVLSRKPSPPKNTVAPGSVLAPTYRRNSIKSPSVIKIRVQ